MRDARPFLTAALILAVAAAGVARPLDDSPPASPSRWEAMVAQAGRALEPIKSLADLAGGQVRAARDAAGAYIQRHAASAERMRGVHLLASSGPNEESAAIEADEDQGVASALEWTPLGEGQVTEHLVMLIHGLDEPGRVWDDLAPVLRQRGLTVCRLDYPNDQPIAASTALLAQALRDLHGRGVRRVDLVGHSMGGLVARDVLTHPDHYAGEGGGGEDLPQVSRLITLGTPHHGSPWAHLQCISDAAEQVDRLAAGPDRHPRQLLGFLADGRGEAARDLLPGSDFLVALNERPLPRGVAVTTVVAVLDPAVSDPAEEKPVEAGFFSLERAAQHRRALTGRLGDGVVSTKSAQLEGVQDVVFVEASHRGMVRRSRLESAVRWTLRNPQDEPPAIPAILERLCPEEPEAP